ncbi:DgyrCDS7027 [Dimorphilus gyrociliatus]|uniref:Integral membrane protein 2 n=1 Tax=Dimorphilus gyrociliatus TaxID=2664684 RepID=A0A7I8VPV0_9ANNE|nr:DgyrCDS7027 [Dimorphilus gyrociliatus]
MTIYTSKRVDKKADKNELEAEEILDALAEKQLLAKQNEDAPKVHAHIVRISDDLIRRRRMALRLVVISAAIVCSVVAVFGGVYLYWRMSHGTFKGYYGVQYYSEEFKENQHISHQSQKMLSANQMRNPHRLEEHIEIDKATGAFEKIEIPHFEAFRQATILHDFEKNLTAIVDKKVHRCFIMSLDRRSVKPPKDFWDLLRKAKQGYYLPKASMVRRKFRVSQHPIKDVHKLGYYIWRECKDNFATYRLKPYGLPYALSKRSVSNRMEYFSGSAGTDVVIAFTILL